MCGIAGIIDLGGQRPAPAGVVQRMARALVHRGPDEGGFFERPGISLASRRLSIVGLAEGQQPMTNEDHSVFVVYNGELFDYVERREELTRRATASLHTAIQRSFRIFTRIITTGMWERLRGQFAIALWDERRQNSISAGIALASRPFLEPAGRLAPLCLGDQRAARLRNGSTTTGPTRTRSCIHLFGGARVRGLVSKGCNFFRPVTAYSIAPGRSGDSPVIAERAYWEMDFPGRGPGIVGQRFEGAGK